MWQALGYMIVGAFMVAFGLYLSKLRKIIIKERADNMALLRKAMTDAAEMPLTDATKRLAEAGMMFVAKCDPPRWKLPKCFWRPIYVEYKARALLTIVNFHGSQEWAKNEVGYGIQAVYYLARVFARQSRKTPGAVLAISGELVKLGASNSLIQRLISEFASSE